MSRHLTDEDLTLHFYGDGPVTAEADVDAHLESCSECRAMWIELTETLKMVDAAAVREPDEGFEAAMWARVERALPARPARPPVFRRPMGTTRRVFNWLVPATGLAATVAVAVWAGHAWHAEHQPAAAPSTTRAASDPAGHERVLLTALGDHFQQSELLLVEVMNAPTSTGDELNFERQSADDLVESSRLYRQTAEQNGDVRLAQMLEDLESVLVEIARSPDRVDRKDLRSLRARIDDDNLLFKVRAVSNQIEERQKSLSTE